MSWMHPKRPRPAAAARRPAPAAPKPAAPPNAPPGAPTSCDLDRGAPTSGADPTRVAPPADPGLASATPSGGTSGNEDSTRAAGYVADLVRENVPPPGPPVEIDPAQLVGPEGDAPPPARPATPNAPARRAPATPAPKGPRKDRR